MTALAAAVAVAAVGGRGAAVVSTTSAAARRRRRWAGEGGWVGCVAPAFWRQLPHFPRHPLATTSLGSRGRGGRRRTSPPPTSGQSLLCLCAVHLHQFVLLVWFACAVRFFPFLSFFFFWSFLSLFSGRCVSPDCSRLTHSHRRPSRFATCGFFIGGAWVFFQRSPLVVRGGGAGGYDAAAQARGRAPFCESGAVRRCVRTGCYSEQASNCDAHFDFLLCVATLLF